MARPSDPAAAGGGATSRGRLASAIYWSVIPAAFVGPGTVTSCSVAGATYGYALLWTLAFSALACVALQEATARVAAATGRDLAPLVSARFGRRFGGAAAGAVVVGCVAYQAGNLAGAAAGLELLGLSSRRVAVGIAAVGAALVLRRGAPAVVGRIMGGIVAVMGVAFVAVAAALPPDPSRLLRGLFVPSLPEGSLATAVALVGTTVVPYNIYLGAGLAKARGLRPRGDARFGVAVAVGIGAVVSAAILVAGTAASGDFTFPRFAETLSARFGAAAAGLFATGLFAAGFSSAITAPLAAGIALRRADADAAAPGGRERVVRFATLGVGVAFALADVRPVALIMAAQALNGVVLPCAAACVVLMANDVAAIGRGAANGPVANALGALVVGVATTLGAAQAAKSVAAVCGLSAPSPEALLVGSATLAAAVVAAVFRRVGALRRAAVDA